MFKRLIKKGGNEPKISSSSSSSDSDIESLETLSLENESFISFKTKSNSTINLSLKSLTNASRLSLSSIRKRKEIIFNSVKATLSKLPGTGTSKIYEDFKNFISKEKHKKLEKNFLGYYECLIPGNEVLSIPKIFSSTARIDLHEEKTEKSKEANIWF